MVKGLIFFKRGPPKKYVHMGPPLHLYMGYIKKMERYLSESEIDEQADLLRYDYEFRGMLIHKLMDDEDPMIAETSEKILKRAVEKGILGCYCKNAFCEHHRLGGIDNQETLQIPPTPMLNSTQYYDAHDELWVQCKSDFEPTEMGGPGGFTGPVDI